MESGCRIPGVGVRFLAMLRVLVTVGAAAVLAVGCGSRVVETGVPQLDGGLDGALFDGATGNGGDAGDGSTGDASRDGSAELDAADAADAARDATDIRDVAPDAPLPDVFQLPDAPPVLADAGCRDAGTRPPRITCDANAQTGCPAGQGCYPYTIPPQGPCDVETYGTACRPTGSGTQGQPCSARGCSAGYVCIVGSGGETCAQLCDLSLSGQCPRGLTCQPVDVSGFGVCA
jgi:hypothetical protein